jgi:hypothetical protein
MKDDGYIFRCLINVKLKFLTMTLSSPPLLHVNILIYPLVFPVRGASTVRGKSSELGSSDDKPGNTRCREAIQIMVFVSIFSTEIQVILQPKELLLDEAMILRRGCLKFRMCNAGTIKYGVLVRMVCEVVSGYVCKKKIHTAEGQNLEDTFHF